MNHMEERPVRLGFWAVLLFGVFAWAPAAYPGYWQALEGFIPVFNVVQSSAIAGVATSADVWRGTGSATYLPALPLLLLDASPMRRARRVDPDFCPLRTGYVCLVAPTLGRPPQDWPG